MPGIAAWLMALMTPLAKQVLVGLGFGIVTYAGVDAAFSTIITMMQAQMGSAVPEYMVYMKMSGIVEAMGLILSALAFKISIMQMSKLVKL